MSSKPWTDRLIGGFRRTSDKLGENLGGLLGKAALDAETLEAIEEALIATDLGPATAGLLPFVLALACAILALSAVLAWLGVARPDVDVVQFVVRWSLREKELPPISIGASAVVVRLRHLRTVFGSRP